LTLKLSYNNYILPIEYYSPSLADFIAVSSFSFKTTFNLSASNICFSSFIDIFLDKLIESIIVSLNIDNGS
jgi:hypothetical protein